MPLHLSDLLRQEHSADFKIDDLDKKLLLTIQSVCNAENVKIPWDKVAAIMGEHISDGAVIQHLAKLRIRMVAQNLDVPPPLRRGAGAIISTNSSGGSSGRSKSAPTKTAKTVKNAKSTSKKGQSDIAYDNDDEEIEYDVDEASDPEEDFGQARSRRTIIKTEETDEDFDKPSKTGDKRKRRSSASKAGKKGKNNTAKNMKEMVAAQSTSKNWTIDYEEKDVSGDEDQYNTEVGDSGQEFDGVPHVASGASFLRFETDSDSEKVKQESKTSSKIVVLSLPGSHKHTENHPDTSDYSVSLGSESGMTEDVVEPEIKSDAIIDASLNEEVLETAPGLAYNSGSGIFGLFGSDATVDRNLINESFFHHNVNPDYTMNQGFGSNNSSYPFSGEDWTVDSNIPSTSTPQYVDSGSGNYMYGNQESRLLPGTLTNPFSNSSFESQSFEPSGLGTSSFGNPGFDTSGAAHSYDVPAFEDSQGPGQYSTDTNGHVGFTPGDSSFSAPPRPSVLTRQAIQPSVFSEPFSATSSNNNNNNPTSMVAAAGDASAMPALDFSPFFGTELDDPLRNPMDLEAFDREWEGAYSSQDHGTA